MRAIVFYIYLSFFLLCGGNYLYSYSSHSPASFSTNQNLAKKQQLKHKKINNHSIAIAIADADIDLDEEFHSTDDFKVRGSNKLLVQKHKFFDSWNAITSQQFNLSFYSKNFKIFAPFLVHSAPIYIRLGVLRI